jgi:hypothetical protein
MRRIFNLLLNYLIGLCGPVLIYGGIRGSITLWKLGGRANHLGALTALLGSLFILTLFVVLMHDTVWPAIKALWKRRPWNRKTKEAVQPTRVNP